MANGDALVDPHWEVTQQHANDLSDMKSSITGLQVGMTGLTNKMDSMLSRLDRPQPKTNFIGIITTACIVGTLLGASVYSNIGPIQTHVKVIAGRQYDHYKELIDNSYTRGKTDQKLEDIIARVSHLDTLDHKRDDMLLELSKIVASAHSAGMGDGE